MEASHSPHLPLEVSSLITSKLDLISLRCLARVNSSWQNAVEPLLWRTVSLELADCPFLKSWDDRTGDDSAESVKKWCQRKTKLLERALAIQPQREKYMEALRVLRLASTASPSIATALLEPFADQFDVFIDAESESSVENWILQRTWHLESALRNRHVRGSYIEELHLLCTKSTSASIIAILRHTPSLHLLSIGPSEINGESEDFVSHCGDSTSLFLQAFFDSSPFRRLLDLSLRITEDQWTRFWPSLQQFAPNLVRLDVELLISTGPALIISEFDAPALPNSIKDLKVSITPETLLFVVGLIRFNGNLQRIHLRGCQLDRISLTHRAVQALLSSCTKRIELSSDSPATNMVWHNMLRHPTAFRNLEELMVEFPDDWNPWVPPLPSLQTLVYTHMEWPDVDGYGYTTSVAHPDEPNDFYAILEECAADILRAPQLGTLIKLGKWFEAINYAALRHSQWIRHRLRVRLFRSFHRGNTTLLHMRELEWKKTVFATKGELPHICTLNGCEEHFWTNATCFNGVGVSGQVLRAVYALAGQEIDWYTPGRGLNLPDEAWELLDSMGQQH